jgi:hypothetical protein
LNPTADPEYFVRAVADQAAQGQIGPIAHNYHFHPLMQMPRLAQLAKSLYQTEQCRFVLPGNNETSVFHHEARSPDGRDIDTVFDQIEQPGSWVALYNVQTDPHYSAFLWDVMEKAKVVMEHEQNIYDVRGFIFISAPPSVTPLHIDRENNFWLQIHGRKTMNVWSNEDTVLVPTKRREEFLMFGGADVPFRDEYYARSHEFDCGPGDGVFFPTTSPHMTRSTTDWVRPGNAVTASIGVVFYSDQTRRAANIHAANHFLRRFSNAEPSGPQHRGLSGSCKYAAGKVIMAGKQLRGGYKVPPGF